MTVSSVLGLVNIVQYITICWSDGKITLLRDQVTSRGDRFKQNYEAGRKLSLKNQNAYDPFLEALASLERVMSVTESVCLRV